VLQLYPKRKTLKTATTTSNASSLSKPHTHTTPGKKMMFKSIFLIVSVFASSVLSAPTSPNVDYLVNRGASKPTGAAVYSEAWLENALASYLANPKHTSQSVNRAEFAAAAAGFVCPAVTRYPCTPYPDDGVQPTDATKVRPKVNINIS
jgi:hypothetical protein